MDNREQVIAELTHRNPNDASKYALLHTTWLEEFFAEMDYLTDTQFERNSKRKKYIKTSANSCLTVGFAGCLGIPLANAFSALAGFLTPTAACTTAGAACAMSGCVCATGTAIHYALRKNISPEQQNQEKKLRLLLQHIVIIHPGYNTFYQYATPLMYQKV